MTGESANLQALLQEHASSCVFVASAQSELITAQTLLTRAYSSSQHCLVLIEVPVQGLKAAAVRKAARRFFSSDLSRQSVHFVESEQLPKPGAKTLVYISDSAEPLYASPDLSYPEVILQALNEKRAR